MKSHKNTPSVSLCITCCDLDFQYLDNLLKEFDNQTIPPDEVIISCSGVKHQKFKFNSAKNFKILSINEEKRHNQSRARNECLSLSSCEYLSFFDVDDIPHPQKIETIKRYCGDYDFLVHSYQRNSQAFSDLNVDNVKTTTSITENPGHLMLKPEPFGDIAHGHLTIKKTLFEKFNYNTSLNTGEDTSLCCELLNNGNSCIFINEPLIFYR